MTKQEINNILSGTSVDQVLDGLLGEARKKAKKKKRKQPVQQAKRVRPGGAPILADLVARIMSRGKRGITVEEVAETFSAAARTTRKWRQQLKDLQYADYHESTDADGNLRMFLSPVYDD
jgi:hypothetical protein